MPTQAELEAQIAELKAKLAKASQPRALRLKVGKKGGVSVYGLNKQFPVTLYKEQWERLFDYVPEIKQFIVDHASELKERE